MRVRARAVAWQRPGALRSHATATPFLEAHGPPQGSALARAGDVCEQFISKRGRMTNRPMASLLRRVHFLLDRNQNLLDLGPGTPVPSQCLPASRPKGCLSGHRQILRAGFQGRALVRPAGPRTPPLAGAPTQRPVGQEQLHPKCWHLWGRCHLRAGPVPGPGWHFPHQIP